MLLCGIKHYLTILTGVTFFFRAASPATYQGSRSLSPVWSRRIASAVREKWSRIWICRLVWIRRLLSNG